eukprot:TRINITY_DN57012_c0_g1_i1.p1 TRINITY_DN57012_c0_g1~~TRINITY_DN57012_c0_g1_i1.p1  ORF type:complete len:334 (+),score=-1.64 TRINITY_DN57012_c0_g1_i1:35-1036(+)
MEREFELDGATIAAKVWGPKDGEPWILLHGWMDNAATWDLIAPMLNTSTQLRPKYLVAMDFSGHGKSSHRQRGPYHFMDYVAEVMAVIDQLGWSKFNVMGHSLGGNVAVILTGLVPERVQRLVVVEATGPASQLPSECPEQALRSVTWRRTGKSTFETEELGVERRHLNNVVGVLPVDACRVLWSRGGLQLPADPPRYTWSHDSAVKQPSILYLMESQVRAFVKRIRCPTLFLYTNDGMIPKMGMMSAWWGPLFMTVMKFLFGLLSMLPLGAMSKKFKRLYGRTLLGLYLSVRLRMIQRATFTNVCKGGHHPHLTNAAKTADAIQQWQLDLTH